MKQKLIFLYELTKFILFSVPLALFLFTTITIISKFEKI